MELLEHAQGSCPIEYTLEIMGGKWKLLIVYHLMTAKVMRYGELKRRIPGITHKMLSSQLKDLESHGILCRKEYPQVPPKVEYSLTKVGATLLPIFGMMYEWGEKNMPRDVT